MLYGRKSESEKFAGAVFTTSLEIMFPNGKAIQGCTSHLLGQNFAKAFDIWFLDKDGNKSYAWQNSWGLSTRSIGIMLGVHGDDKGIVMPPRVAPIQIVIVPIIFDATKDKVLEKCRIISDELSSHGIRVLIDDSDYRAGWKFNKWEMKGVPLRIELGPKDLDKGQVIISRRDNGVKEQIKFEHVTAEVKRSLEDIHDKLLEKSRKMLSDSIVACNTIDDMLRIVDDKKIAYAPFCDEKICEENIKEQTGAKTLNSPVGQDEKTVKDLRCIHCGKPARLFYFGKSY